VVIPRSDNRKSGSVSLCVFAESEIAELVVARYAWVMVCVF
jgi:hypothetical protein